MECSTFEMHYLPTSRILFPFCSSLNCSFQFPGKDFSYSRSLLSCFRLKLSSSVAINVLESSLTNDLDLDLDLDDGQNKNADFHDVSRTLSRTFPGWDGSHESERTKPKPRKLFGKERLRRYSVMLSSFACEGSLLKVKAIHGHQLRNMRDPDTRFGASLVNAYSKCVFSLYAHRVLAEMPEQDVVAWTALIQGFVTRGCGEDGINMFCKMKMEGVRPNDFTLTVGVRACNLCLDVGFGKQLHAEAVKLGYSDDLFFGSALVDLYAKCDHIELADKVFFSMPEHNEVLWNVLLKSYVQVEDEENVLRLFCRMSESETRCSTCSLSTVLKCCADMRNFRQGQVVHALAIKCGSDRDKILGSSLAGMYSKCERIVDALEVFTRIRDPDIVAWSAMITSLNQAGFCKEASSLFYLMRQEGTRPNEFSFTSLVSGSSHSGDLQYGQSLHAYIYKSGFNFDISVCNALIMMYMKNGSVMDGFRVFQAMKATDLESWNVLLSGFHDYESCEFGPRMFIEMLKENFRPNMYTFVSILRSCSNLLDVNFGKQIHAHIVKNNLEDNEFVGTALVDLYGKSRYMTEAYAIFDKLISRDVFTWTVMITGYSQSDGAEKAMKCLNAMQMEGVKPNEFTLAGCLSGCSHIAALECGRQLHTLAIKSGNLSDMFVSGALVDMYAKCGCIEDAEYIFLGLDTRDTVLWNTMIFGFSHHGRGQKALETFQTMIGDRYMPDEVTFIGILSTCSHMGLIERGKGYFKSMSSIYGITPTIEHYACMVDILCQAGRFDEVEKLIKEMNLSPHVLIWETVLGACQKLGNVEYGVKAADNLFQLDPGTDSNYILLSNIFASKGMWEDVRKVRSLMTNQGVKKEPGCSWVEIDGQVHVFVARDFSHPRSREIQCQLEEIGEKMSAMGYIPQTEHVLHDVMEKDKKELLKFHSERLALGLSLISTSSMKKIRIFKNLRICIDCHEVMKLVSLITDREIVVRDINRFHYFRNGSCSCCDRW